MSAVSTPWPRWTLLLCLLLLAGCGRGNSNPVRVAGKVSFRGGPVNGGTIVFTPDQTRGGSGPLGHAQIQFDGSYQLKTGELTGTVPGWYRVTVAAVQAFPPVPGQPPLLPRSLLPDKYRDPEFSGLICEIQPGKENTVNFNLE